MKISPVLISFCALLLLSPTVLSTKTGAIASEQNAWENPSYITRLAPTVGHSSGIIAYPSAFNPKNPTAQKSAASESIQVPAVYTQGILKNALRPVITPTYDGSGQAVHPSVIDFKTEYGLNSWRGYRYWMVMTPYPNGYYHLENPSLLASQDGLKWVVPAGFAKPLDTRTEKYNFNSDPSLVFDPDSKSLLVYWRESLRGQYDRFWRTKLSEKGKPEPKVMVLEQYWGKPEQLVLSPSIWRKNAKEWYMWVSNGEGAIYLYDSRDGLAWGNRRTIQAAWKNWNQGLVPWHLEVKPNLKQNKLVLLISGWPKSGKMADQVLVYAETPLNDLTAVSMPLDRPILTSGMANQWDDDFVYKSSFVLEEKNGLPYYRIWYSARTTGNAWHTGYAEGALE